MRKSRIFRLVVRIFLLIFTVSLSIISALAGLSAINILTNEENIVVDLDGKTVDFSDPDPHNWYVYVPFNIINDGYFDLNYFSFSISIDMHYNTSHSQIANIITNSTTIYSIPRGASYAGAFYATNFTVPPFNPSITPYFYADLMIIGYYTFNLLSFRAVVENYNITI